MLGRCVEDGVLYIKLLANVTSQVMLETGF